MCLDLARRPLGEDPTAVHHGHLIRVAAVGLAVSVSMPAQAANIVVNGGFETGDFTGWTLTGNTGFSGVQCPGPGFVPEGNCDAFFGPVGSDAVLSQTLSTLVNSSYEITFQFENDGGTPNDFSASFGGTSLFSGTDLPASPFHLLSFTVPATGSSSTLQFAFRQDPAFMQLDAVTVSPVPEPGTMALLGAGIAGLWWRRRKV
jgi:PEP-CTERM motif